MNTMKKTDKIPAVSVIIPFYQTPKLKFRNCIECFLHQTFRDFELLLVDDGNSPDYRELCMEYVTKDERVRLLTQKKSGVAAARNYGLKSARGSLVVFSDSDDYVDISFLEVMCQSLGDYDLVICGVCEQWHPSYNGSADLRVFCSTPSQHNWLQYVNFSVNKIYRKSILDNFRIRFDTDVRLGEDALFLYRYLSHCKTIRCIADMLYHYVPNPESAVKTYYPQYWNWEKRVIACQNKLFHKYPLNPSEEFFMRRWLFTKVKGAMYYYLSMETDAKKRDAFVREIMDSRYFRGMYGQWRSNPCYSRQEKVLLALWKLFGVRGVRLGYLYACFRK